MISLCNFLHTFSEKRKKFFLKVHETSEKLPLPGVGYFWVVLVFSCEPVCALGTKFSKVTNLCEPEIKECGCKIKQCKFYTVIKKVNE